MIEIGGRRSGRTTRMLKEAMEAASQGRAVYVLAANQAQARELQLIVDREMPEGHGIKCEVPERLFDWQRMWSPGAHPNCLFLADHFAITNRFQKMLDQLFRHCQPQEEQDA